MATILLVLGGIGIVLASTGWWLERNFLHTSRFTGTPNDLLDQDEIQAELTNVLVRQLSAEAGTDLQVAEPFLASIVGQVVDSGAFRHRVRRRVVETRTASSSIATPRR